MKFKTRIHEKRPRKSPLRVLSILTLLGLAHAASAGEARTYYGTLGKSSIVVELQSPREDGTFVGRYAYMRKGIDIPLHGTVDTEAGFSLDEEMPCTDELCKRNDDREFVNVPIGAVWSLDEIGGGQLTGQWKDKASGKKLPLKLEKIGSRPLGDDPSPGLDILDPYMASTTLGYPPSIGEKDLPYDFRKMKAPQKEGPIVTKGDYSYRMDLDERSGIDYPVIVKLGDVDTRPVNRFLWEQKTFAAIRAFDCLSRAYAGYNWNEVAQGKSNGYDGNWQAEILHLSTRLIGIQEGGSYFCDAAHPDNFVNYLLVDARTGQKIVPETLLKGWVAKDADGKIVDPETIKDKSALTFGPDDELRTFALSRRQELDQAWARDCGVDDLVNTNLGVYFTDTELVLNFRDLPYAIMACGDDLIRVPIKDARALLTDEGARYFEVLDGK